MIKFDFLIATYLFPNSNHEFIDFKSYFLNLQTTRLMFGIIRRGDRLHSGGCCGNCPTGRSAALRRRVRRGGCVGAAVSGRVWGDSPAGRSDEQDGAVSGRGGAGMVRRCTF
jgi:hypothetical protein